MPDYETLLKYVGITLETKNDIGFGAIVRNQQILSNPKIGTPAYKAGFQKGDKLLKVGETVLDEGIDLNSILNRFKIGQEVVVSINRFGNERTITLTIGTDVSYGLQIWEEGSKELTKKIKQQRESWLNSKV